MPVHLATTINMTQIVDDAKKAFKIESYPDNRMGHINVLKDAALKEDPDPVTFKEIVQTLCLCELSSEALLEIYKKLPEYRQIFLEAIVNPPKWLDLELAPQAVPVAAEALRTTSDPDIKQIAEKCLEKLPKVIINKTRRYCLPLQSYILSDTNYYQVEEKKFSPLSLHPALLFTPESRFINLSAYVVSSDKEYNEISRAFYKLPKDVTDRVRIITKAPARTKEEVLDSARGVKRQITTAGLYEPPDGVVIITGSMQERVLVHEFTHAYQHFLDGYGNAYMNISIGNYRSNKKSEPPKYYTRFTEYWSEIEYHGYGSDVKNKLWVLKNKNPQNSSETFIEEYGATAYEISFPVATEKHNEWRTKEIFGVYEDVATYVEACIYEPQKIVDLVSDHTTKTKTVRYGLLKKISRKFDYGLTRDDVEWEGEKHTPALMVLKKLALLSGAGFLYKEDMRKLSDMLKKERLITKKEAKLIIMGKWKELTDTKVSM